MESDPFHEGIQIYLIFFTINNNMKSISQKDFISYLPNQEEIIIFFKDIFRISYFASKKFVQDHCPIRSSAIAYSILISIVPLLTIWIHVTNVNPTKIRSNLSSFMSVYGFFDASELLRILDGILEQTSELAGVGLVFFLYGATTFFRNIEDSFNHIYRAPTMRPLLYRFSLYISSFVLLPLILLFAGQGADWIQYQFNPPEFRKILKRNGKLWLLSSKGSFLVYSDTKSPIRFNLYAKTKTQPPYRELVIDLKTKKSGRVWEILPSKARSSKARYLPLQSNRSPLVAAAQNRDTIFAVSRDGILYYSKDEGYSWDCQRIIFHSDAETYAPIIKELFIREDGKLIILVDQISYSAILTRQAEWTWKYEAFEESYYNIIEIKNIVTQGKNSFRNGLYLSGKGGYRYSFDLGASWSKLRDAKYGGNPIPIAQMKADRNGNMFFLGTKNTFWIQTPNKAIYPDIQVEQNQTLHGFEIRPDGRGFLYGTNGLFRFTGDWGRTWLKSSTKFFEDKSILTHLLTNRNNLYMSGENNLLFQASLPILTDKLDAKGNEAVKGDYKILSPGIMRYSSFLRNLSRQFVFLLISAVIFMLYVLVPHTYVSIHSAAIGSIISTITMSTFFRFFQHWVQSFSKAEYIYGVWAAIPLFMFTLLVCSYIILFGLEISYAIQFRRSSKEQIQIPKRILPSS